MRGVITHGFVSIWYKLLLLQRAELSKRYAAAVGERRTTTRWSRDPAIGSKSQLPIIPAAFQGRIDAGAKLGVVLPSSTRGSRTWIGASSYCNVHTFKWNELWKGTPDEAPHKLDSLLRPGRFLKGLILDQWLTFATLIREATTPAAAAAANEVVSTSLC